jgi:hypothetical protein
MNSLLPALVFSGAGVFSRDGLWGFSGRSRMNSLLPALVFSGAGGFRRDGVWGFSTDRE